MKIAITGASGFIGKNLINRLKDEHDICAIMRNSKSLVTDNVRIYNLTDDIKDLINFFSQEKFDGVIHLASLFITVHKESDINNLIESNVTLGTRLLEACTKSGVRWFINTGTYWQNYQNAEYAPVNLYAATKQAFIDMAAFYTSTSNISFATIKLNDTFGPDDVRPKIFNLWKRISVSNEELDMSAGEQLIDTLYIDDVIDGFQLLVNNINLNPEIYRNKEYVLRSNKRLTLRDLASVFESTLGVNLNINWGKRGYRDREVMIPYEKGHMLPGWKQKTAIEDGILKMFKGDEL